jgi:NUMOD4 motif/NUMOD1 domain
LDLSLDDLKGEQWEDIPGLDGYFLISNFGRIKRQQYDMQYRNGAIYRKPEMIIKPMIVEHPNNFKNDLTNFLTARVKLTGRRYSIMPSRLVYHCFVKSFDIDNDNLVVICRDTDNFNIQPSNLRLVTKQERVQRTIERKRFRSPLLDMTEEQRIEQRRGITEKLSKEVSQYSMTGKRLRIFSSAAMAERATGIFATSIRYVAYNKKLSAGGFIWRWGRALKVNVAALKQERRDVYVKHHGQKVTQYSLQGKLLAHYACVKDAAAASGVHVNAINKILKGEYKSTKGFFWKKGYGKGDIDLSHHVWGRESTSLTQSKPVKQYDANGKYIQRFDSVKLAAEAVDVSTSSLVGALKGRQQTSAGFKWKYG